MGFSLFRVKYIPVYVAFNANLAWIVQDYLLANGIDASIEVEPCSREGVCETKDSYAVCVPGSKAEAAQKFVEQCEATKIIGFLAA
ncbi:MAG: hypothetical protein ACD_81C00185G0006 [uncultured bacterium]|uniref:DUF2007 domain-containing protein n=2 Tax=Candidatus Wolfeibacteriota TaxID=1752735 RepID=A0A0G1HB46_9BACT|nr:MAG: hypothetical protein ACD_81C00185G0006 [uncultured bacterium]KKR12812.1 MAG: hypothetical protein UT41_C0001G0356 [Candidatus Wolfebacteria bacterium GW2011_GWC2_39_22]KKT43743.1 MAG: hypothetical protein UW32_C0001G0335 [Candidatus Wolfebacteria bacterium GW2011_GWE2_44_13]HBI25526.1 hypothetical protein [Candidatus Wolfebacteria bacterium]